MTSPLPDGRVPMDVLLDEKDEEFLAEWDAADADALAATRGLLDRVQCPPLPAAGPARAAHRLRQDIARPGWPGALLIECSGLRRTAAGRRHRAVAAAGRGRGVPGREPTTGAARTSVTAIPTRRKASSPPICAIDHFDWLAAITALAEGGPAPPRQPPTWPGTCATTTRRTPKTRPAASPARRTKPTSPTSPTASTSPTTTSTTTSPWKPVPAADLAVAGARRDRRRRAADPRWAGGACPRPCSGSGPRPVDAVVVTMHCP